MEAKREPNRVPSAYMRFCADKRSMVKRTYPLFRFTDVARKLAELWSSADSATKNVNFPSPAFLCSNSCVCFASCDEVLGDTVVTHLFFMLDAALSEHGYHGPVPLSAGGRYA